MKKEQELRRLSKLMEHRDQEVPPRNDGRDNCEDIKKKPQVMKRKLVGSDAIIPKKRGRPKGSKNKPKMTPKQQIFLHDKLYIFIVTITNTQLLQVIDKAFVFKLLSLL